MDTHADESIVMKHRLEEDTINAFEPGLSSYDGIKNIQPQHISTVYGFIRENIVMPDAVVNIVLLYYAKPIIIRIKLKRSMSKIIKHILFYPLHDSWSSVVRQINEAIGPHYALVLQIYDSSGNILKRDHFESYIRDWRHNDVFAVELHSTVRDDEEQLKRLGEDFRLNIDLEEYYEDYESVKKLQLMGFSYADCVEALLANMAKDDGDMQILINYIFADNCTKKEIYEKSVALATQHSI